jgi:hypothetical protein
MRKLLLIAVLFPLSQIAQGQDTLRLKSRIYKTVVTTINPPSLTSGYFASISDSSIYVSSSANFSMGSPNKEGLSKIDYDHINAVKFRRKGATARAILIGSLIGVVSGAIVGAASYTKPENEIERAINILLLNNKTSLMAVGGLMGALSGGLVGGLVGVLAKKTFVIGGSKEKFQTMKSKILF